MKQFYKYILTLVAILMTTTPAWAGKAKVHAKSDPSEGGFVYVATSTGNYSPSNNSHNAEQSGSFWGKQNKTFYLYYKEASNYHFKGWYETDANILGQWDNCNVNSSSSINQGQSITHEADGGATTADYYYYAIFATVQATQTPSFSTIAMGNTTTGTLSIKHAHANSVKIEITGEHASDFKINNTTSHSFSSTALGTQNITITFKPTCAGERKANLKITNENGLPELNITIQANATILPQTIAWNDVYNQNMFVGSTLNVSATASTGHAVTYESSNPNVISVSGNTLTAKAIGEAVITATQYDGCTYQTVSTSLTFTVSDKKTPTFWLNGDPNQLTDNLKTEDTRTITITNVDERLTADYDPNLLSYTFNGSTATIKALDAGTATLTLTQPETTQIFFGERTFTFNITKYDTNTLTNDLATEYMVDDIIPEADIYTINNNEVPVQIISGNESILKFENGQLKAVGAGTTTLTVKQPATNKWVERSATKTITVHKFDITPTINPNTAYWNELVANPFTATTTHKFSGATHSITDFSVVQQDNEHIALMDATTRDIQTYYTNGQVNFLITRDEDYKYNALNQTLTLTVNANWGCNLTLSAYSTETGTGDNSTSGTVTLNGAGDLLSFNYKLNSTANVSHYLTTQYSLSENGEDFQDIAGSQVGEEDTKLLFHSLTLPKGTKRIRFKRTDNGWGDKKFEISNITVTRAQDIRPTEGGRTLNSTNALVLPTVAVAQPSSKQFHLEWSACTDIKIVWSNPKFTINTTDITTHDGSLDITVSCNTSEVGTFTDNVVIYNQEQMETFPITCEVYTKWLTDSIRGSATHSMKVDKTWETDFYFPIQRASQYPTTDGAFHYAIEHTFQDENTADRNPDYPYEVISYTDGVITAHNAGTAILTIKHDETPEHFASQQFTCTLTVSKHDVERTWKDPVYFNDTIIPYFTTTNTTSPIVIVSQTDTDVAKLTNEFNPTSNNSLDLITFNKEASTTVTVSQAENYKWNGYSEEHTITPIDTNNHVTFTLTQENYISAFKHSFVDPAANDQSKGPDWQSGGIYFGGEGALESDEGWNWNEKYYIIQFTGIPDSIYFDASRSGAATGTINLSVSEGKTPDNLTEVWSNSNNSENNKIIRKLNPDSRYLKFSYTGNLWGLFKNITVTELNEFRAVEVNNHEVDVEFLNFDSIQVNTSKTMSFAFKYANAGYKVELISTDPHFTINPSSITDIGGENHGTRQIDVTYTSSVPHATNEDAMIIISDEHGHKDTVQLIASAYKLKQTLRWRADFEAVEKPLIPLNGGDISDAAYSTSGLTIKYLSDNSNVIAISSDGTTLIPMGEGEATITATQTGNELWNPAESITKTFVVTDKRLQYIIWNDPLSDLVKSDNNQTITLTAQVHVQTEDGQIVYSPEQTAKLTYQSANTSIVSVSGSLLTIHSVGKTTLTAHVPATDDFAAATLTVPVIVRPETAGCEDVLLLDENGPIQFFQYSLNEIIKEAMPLDLNKGIPGYVLVEHYGESWDLAIQYYAAEIRVEESTDGGNSWNTITTIYPAEDKVNIDSIPLSRTATHIRFARNSGGQGYQFLQNIKVHPAQFIEGPDVIDFGQIHVGSREEQTFTIAYSNIKSTLSPVVSSTDVVATPSSFGECGEFGTQTIQVFWTPSQLGENMQETVTFTDFNSGMEKVVILRAQNIQKGLQQLNWDAPKIIEHCGHIHFPEKTTADLPITWEVIEGNQYADFVDGTLTLFQNGTIQIKGSNNGSNNYEPFEKIYTFQIAINPIFMGTEDEDWNNTNNWNICRLPYEHEAVTIQASTVLTEAISIAGITFAMGENGNLGSIHITSTGGLSVGAQGVTGAATDGSSLIIDNLKTGAGFLRISPKYTGTMPKTTVRYQTKSTLDDGANKNATWQYIGAPGANCQFTVDYITWLYQWSEPQNWINKTGTLTLEPFAGYAITQYGKPTYELIAEPINQNQTITLTKTSSGMNGNNLFANSFMAPIDAKNFTPEDFSDYNTDREDIVKTFYIFNSGSWNEWNKYDTEQSKGSNGNDTPGQYCAVPAFSSSYMDGAEITTLPPMQGIYVIANADGAQIRLNYDKHVWKAGTDTAITTDMHEPMRTPQRIQAQEQMQRSSFRRIRLQLNSANSGADRLYIIQSDETTPDYDNGYDAPNQFAEGMANIYTTESFGKMEVSCSNNIDSMYIGFQAGNDNQYTLTFSSIIGDSIYLKDLSNDTIFQVFENGQYQFTAQPLSTNDLRFQVLLHPINEEDTNNGNGGISTDIDNVTGAHIWHSHNHLYISNAPANSTMTLYNINGQLILSTHLQHSTHTIDLGYLQKGVYILQLGHQMYKFVCQ